MYREFCYLLLLYLSNPFYAIVSVCKLICVYVHNNDLEATSTFVNMPLFSL